MSSNSQLLYTKRLPGNANNLGMEIDTREYVFNTHTSISSHFNFMVGLRKDYPNPLTSQSNTAYTSTNSAYNISITSLYEYVSGYLYRDNYIVNNPIFLYGLTGNKKNVLRVFTIPLNELAEDRIKPGTFGMNFDGNTRFNFSKFLEFKNSPKYNFGTNAAYVLLADENWLCCDVSEKLDYVHTTGKKSSFTVEIVFSPKEIQGMTDGITGVPYRQFLLYRPRLVDRSTTIMDSNVSISAKMFDYTYSVSAIPSFYSYNDEINNKYQAYFPNPKEAYVDSVTSNNDCAMAIIMVYYPPVTSITASLSGQALSGCTTFQIVRNGQMYGEYLALTSSITAGIPAGTTGTINLFDNNWHQLVWSFQDSRSEPPFKDNNNVYLDSVKLPNINPTHPEHYSAGRSITRAWYLNNTLKAPTIMALGAKLQVIDQQLTTNNSVIHSALNDDIRYLYRRRNFEGIYGLQIYDSQQQIDYGQYDDFHKNPALAVTDTQIYSFFGASEIEKYLSSYFGTKTMPEKNPDLFLDITDVDAKKMLCTDIVKDMGCFGFNGKIAGLWIYNKYFSNSWGGGSGYQIQERECIPQDSFYPAEMYPFFYGSPDSLNLKFVEPLKRSWVLNPNDSLIANFCFWKDEKNSLIVNNRLDFREYARYWQKGLKFNDTISEASNYYYGCGLLTKTGTDNPSVNLVDYYEFYDKPTTVFQNTHLKHGKIIQNNLSSLEGQKSLYKEIGVIFYDLGIVVLDTETRINGSNIIDNINYPFQWSVTGYNPLLGHPQFLISNIKFETENYKYVNYMDIKLEQDECNTVTNPTNIILNNLAYPTTIGLYNDNDELLFVAKMNHKIAKTNYYGIRYKIKLAY